MNDLNKILQEKGLTEEDIIRMIESADKPGEDVEVEQEAPTEEVKVEKPEKKLVVEEEEPEQDLKDLVKEEIRKQLAIVRGSPPKGEIVDKAVGENRIEKEKFSIYV